MPKGRHKGGKRHFTNFEAMEEQKKKEEKERQWRKDQGETDSEDEDGEKSGSGSSSESESESEGEQKEQKAKGVGGLIECENPNRVATKPQKVATVSTASPAASKVQLSRREREEVEKQRATAHYRKMHAEGKTEEARSDLARLAIIKQQRDDAAKKRDDVKKARDDAASAKREQTARALNKKKT